MKNKDINLGAESAVQDIRERINNRSSQVSFYEELMNILRELEWEAHNGHYEVRKDLL